MYALIKASLNRPVTVFMFYLALLLLGFLALRDLPVDLFPSLDYPEIVINTGYDGALPEEVEQNVTRYLEEAVASVAAIRELRSQSFAGESLIRVRFDWGTDMKYAALAVRQQVDRVSDWLPRDAQRPVVLQQNPQNRPIATLTLSGSDTRYLARYADYVVKRRLEQIQGIAYAAILGAPQREIYVECDLKDMRRLGIKRAAVERALRENNLLFNAGSIKKGHFRLALRVQSEYDKPADIGEIFVPVENAAPLKLSRIARVYEGVADRESLSRINGEECIALDIHKETSANTLLVNRRLQPVLAQLKEEAPQVVFHQVYNQAGFIEQALNSVVFAVLLGGVLAFLVLFIFLRNIRAPLIIGISIPLSIIGAFILMYFTDITLNIISLAGLALGAGMLVDNAIVILENISRHREQGNTVGEAALQGTREVALPITASTLTTLAVFVPIVFLKDLSGVLFGQQAATASFALIASLVVGVTLMPVLYKRFFRNASPLAAHASEKKWLVKLEARYHGALSFVLKKQKPVLAVTIAFLLAALLLLFNLERRLVPEVEQHGVFIDITYPPGVSVDFMDRHFERIRNTVSAGEAEFTYNTIGKKEGVFSTYEERKINKSNSYIRLNTSVATDDFMARLRRHANPNERVEYSFKKEQTALEQLTGSNIFRIDLVVAGPDFMLLDTIATHLAGMLRQSHSNAISGSNFFERTPVLEVDIDEARALRYNVPVNAISDALKHGLQGMESTQFRDFDRKIQVVLRGSAATRHSLDDLLAQPVGQGYPLKTFLKTRQTQQLSAIEHIGQARVYALYITPPAGNANEVVLQLQEDINDLALPTGYRVYIGGSWQETMQSLKMLMFAFLLSVLLVYLILAAQYESLRIPLVVMFTVPLAFIGIAPLLWMSQAGMNIMSAIGIVVVVGIVVNDGIIKVDFIERLRKSGRPLTEAVKEAGSIRLRPILMTTITTVMGLLPLALGLGPGASLQQPMAVAIIGGISVATLLTLFVLPVIYMLFNRIEVIS